MRILKRLIIPIFCAVSMIFVAYLLLPERFVSALGHSNYSPEEKITYVKNPLNDGRPCAANTTYVSKSSSQDFENEGFAFEINDDCANLQRLLVHSIRDRIPITFGI